MTELTFDVAWDMPNHKTFEIPSIHSFIVKHLGTDWRSNTVDPFPYPFEQDAIDYLKTIPTGTVKQLVFDPPYSQRQLYEMYHKAGISYNHPKNNGYWSKCKVEIGRCLASGAKVLTFGWTGAGIGKKFGCKEIDGLVVRHGSMHNATICVAEIKIQESLF